MKINEQNIRELFAFSNSNSNNKKVENALKVIRDNEPVDGYYLAFSGGKDSVVIKELAKKAKVKFIAFYNNTTIDPPELVNFIKEFHKDVIWNNPKMNMMQRVALKPGLPPTRSMRWCCQEYKENGGKGKTKIIGVRWEESRSRRKNWNYISEDTLGDKAVCPIIDWTKEEIWQFIKNNNIPYCSLYDEGWERLGCVGCPLQTRENQKREFDRWPKYKQNWEKAIKKNWEVRHNALKRNGLPYYHSKFRTAEDMWQWWLTAKQPDYFRGDCQSMLLFTNEDVSEI